MPPNTEKINYGKLGFFSKFFELNRVMWTTNKGLLESHPYDSRPESWVLLKRGINFWESAGAMIYLLGNPFTWWLVTGVLVLTVFIASVIEIIEKRGISLSRVSKCFLLDSLGE